MTRGNYPLHKRGGYIKVIDNTRFQKSAFGRTPGGGAVNPLHRKLAQHGSFPVYRQRFEQRLPTKVRGKTAGHKVPRYHKRVSGQTETEGASGPGVLLDGQKSHRGGQGHYIAGVLQPSVSGAETRRTVATSNRPQRSEQIPESREFQNGNSRDHKVGVEEGRMVDFSRPFRRLSPHSTRREVQEIFPVRSEGKGIPVHGYTVRTGVGSASVHPTRPGGEVNIKLARYRSSYLSGRLLNQSGVGTVSKNSNPQSSELFAAAGVHNEHSEVGVDTVSSVQVRRLRIRCQGGGGVPLSRSCTGHQRRGSGINPAPLHDSRPAGILSGAASGHREDGSQGQTPYATPPTQVKCILEASTVTRDQNSCRAFGNPGVVDSAGKPSETSSTSQTISGSNSFHRRFGDGMGGSYSTPHNAWSLGGSGEGVAYKLPGIKGGSSGSHRVPRTSEREGCADLYGQRNSSSPHKQTRGHQVSSDVRANMGSSAVVPPAGDSTAGATHRRRKKCNSRRSVKDTSSAPDGVDAPWAHLSRSLQEVGNPGGRSVRDTVQRTATSIHVSSPRPRGAGSRRHVHFVEGDVRLCVSPLRIVGQGSTKAVSGQATSSFDSSVVASSILAAGVEEVVDSGTTASQTGSWTTVPDSYGSHSPEPGNVEPTRLLGTTPHHTLNLEVSERIRVCQRPSTRRVYDSRVQVLKEWCESKGILLEQLSIEQVLEFLLELFKRNKSPATIEGYRTAIADSLPRLGLSSHAGASRLIRSFHRDKPRAVRRLPPWDLEVVLEALKGPPFEPMFLAPLKFVTLKSVFLLALASGSRRSEMHAWMEEGVFLDSSGSKVCLKPCVSFLAKNQRAESAPHSFEPVIIPALLVEEGVKESSLCPVRALRIYRERAKEVRGERVKLFIAFKSGFKSEIKAPTISSWLKQTIVFAYKCLKPDQAPSLEVKAHQVRAMAASWSCVGGASMQQLMTSCHWRNPSTFTKFYLQPIAWRNGDHFALSPFVAAQTIVKQALQLDMLPR